MKDSASQSTADALAELLEVSPQVLAAVILDRDSGELVDRDANTSAGAGRRLAETCTSIIEAAERSRRELGREPISQVELGTANGHVFVVTDAAWIVAAVTEPDPTVGLVFYDLKTALRAVREAAAGVASAAAGAEAEPASPRAAVPSSSTDDHRSTASSGDLPDVEASDDENGVAPAEEAATAAGDSGADQPTRRWRRRNR